MSPGPADLPMFTTPNAADAPRPAARRLAGAIPPQPGDPNGSNGHHPEPLLNGAPAAAPPNGAAPRAALWPVDPQAVREIRAAVSTALTTPGTDGPPSADRDGQRARQIIADEVSAYTARLLRAGETPLAPHQQSQLRQAVFDALFGLGRIQPLLDDPRLQNLDVHGHDNVWLTYDDGRVIQGPPVADSDDDLIDEIARIAHNAKIERPFDAAHRHLDLALPDGSRLSASAWFTPYPMLSIRKHQFIDVDLGDLRRMGMISASIEAFLAAVVRAGKSVVISGIPDAGKTTLTRAVLNTLPPLVAIGIIETEDELGLHTLRHRHPRVWAGQEMVGGGEVLDGRIAGQLTVNEMIPMALRANVQVLVVGEVRGHEIIAMLEAMQIGHNSVTTIHAKNGRDTIERMVTCATQHGAVSTTWAYRQVCQLVDVIVHIGVVNETVIGGRKHRFVDEIVLPELSGDAPYAVPALYQPDPDGRAVPTGDWRPPFLDELVRVGFDPQWLTSHRGGWDEPLDTLRRPG